MYIKKTLYWQADLVRLEIETARRLPDTGLMSETELMPSGSIKTTIDRPIDSRAGDSY
jgi:hypothetical protein